MPIVSKYAATAIDGCTISVLSDKSSLLQVIVCSSYCTRVGQPLVVDFVLQVMSRYKCGSAHTAGS